jgi:hypothetical protein
MKSLMKTSSLVILLFGLLVAWPAPVARGDGDGVGILPHYQDNGGDDPESRVDGGHVVPRHELFASTYGFLTATTPDGRQTTFVFPPRPTPFAWRALATSIANNLGYRGVKFTIGYVAVDSLGQPTNMLTARVDGGSSKPPVVTVHRY